MKNNANLTRRLSNALPFAHLLGLSAAKAQDDDQDDERKQGADESDEDYAKRMEELDKEDNDGDDEEDEEPAKKSKKSKKASSDDDDQEDDDDSEKADDDDSAKAVKAARNSERARCAAIFASPAAGIRPDMAAHLAFTTNMSSASAIAMLEVAAKGGSATADKKSLANRMASVQTPNPGANAGSPSANPSQALAQQILAAGKKARGEK
ncbi:hypothetical protein ACO0K2_04330 [Undibacterium sp. MH2W]|uniref:hypothetical protein n=1 Tax=Undibacterium sp. MH2W TaxID=3413044 RepID=UPI003BEF77C5